MRFSFFLLNVLIGFHFHSSNVVRKSLEIDSHSTSFKFMKHDDDDNCSFLFGKPWKALKINRIFQLNFIVSVIDLNGQPNFSILFLFFLFAAIFERNEKNFQTLNSLLLQNRKKNLFSSFYHHSELRMLALTSYITKNPSQKYVEAVRMKYNWMARVNQAKNVIQIYFKIDLEHLFHISMCIKSRIHDWTFLKKKHRKCILYQITNVISNKFQFEWYK